jgi:hypothetical protein
MGGYLAENGGAPAVQASLAARKPAGQSPMIAGNCSRRGRGPTSGRGPRARAAGGRGRIARAPLIGRSARGAAGSAEEGHPERAATAPDTPRGRSSVVQQPAPQARHAALHNFPADTVRGDCRPVRGGGLYSWPAGWEPGAAQVGRRAARCRGGRGRRAAAAPTSTGPVPRPGPGPAAHAAPGLPRPAPRGPRTAGAAALLLEHLGQLERGPRRMGVGGLVLAPLAARGDLRGWGWGWGWGWGLGVEGLRSAAGSWEAGATAPQQRGGP